MKNTENIRLIASHYPVRKIYRVRVSALALLASLALGHPALIKKASAQDESREPRPSVSCDSASDCIENGGSLNYNQGSVGGILSGGSQNAVAGLGVDSIPAGESRYLWNKDGGSLNISTNGGTGSPAIRAYGLYAYTGRGDGATVVLQNDGAVTVTDTGGRGGAGGHSAGMALHTHDGGDHTGWLINTGSLDVKVTGGSSIVAIGMTADASSMTSGAGRDIITSYNSGTITVNHTGNRGAWGIEQFTIGTALDGTIINDGTVNVITNAFGAMSRSNFIGGAGIGNAAAGLLFYTNGAGGSAEEIYNYGTVNATTTADYGIAHGLYAGPIGYGTAISILLENNGTLNVQAAGNNGYASGITGGSTFGYGGPGGIPVTGTIINGRDGVINVSAGATGEAYGIIAAVGQAPNGANPTVLMVANAGMINVSGKIAHQLYVSDESDRRGGNANVTLWNLSSVAATSVDQRIFAVANKATLNFGDGKGNGAKLILRTSDAGDNGHDGADVTDLIANKGGTVTGVIDTVYSGGNVNGDNAHLYQATLEGYDNYANQSVFVDRAWQFNAADDSKSAVNCATVSCALYSSTQGLGLDNAGTLDVAVTDAVGAGMYANLRTMAGIDNKTVSLLNSGTVNATADGSNGKAYGLFVRLQDGQQSADVTNTGIINVRGATAHQLYVMGEPGVGGGTANLKRWNLELYDRTSGNQSVFAVADGATLNFDATHMMLRPGDVGKGYENNKYFNVEDMVYNYGNGSQVTGKIGSVSTPLPMLTAHYGRVDEKGPDQWNNQWVSLNVDAEESDGPTVNAGVVDSMQSQVDRVGNLLVGGGGGGGIGLGDGDLTSVQLKIYYGNQQRRGTGASVTDSTGAVAYADYEIGEGHTLGWHGGAEYAHLRAKSKTLNINSLSAIVGGQGRYNFSDTTYLRGQVSGILSNNNNHFNAFDGSTSKVSTINFGLYGAVYAGYDYKPDENNTITPELGISALWSHTPSMDVKYDKSPDLNHSYAAQNYSAVYANAGIRWTGGLDINGTLLKPTVMAGVRQTLGDGKVKSAMSFNGNHFDTSITRDRTMGIVDVGVSTTVSVGLDVGLNYRGEYGSTTTNHVGYLNGTIRF